jgi:CelD/BcsL family acetyltransferase involved in cellulose biosynthesis
MAQPISWPTEETVAARSATLPEVRVETVSDYQTFVNLEPAWNRVLNAAGLENPFLEYVWARTWWESFGSGSSLHILLLKADDEPVAIAPLISTTIRMWGIKVRRLGFLYNAHVPHADFIIASRPKEVYQAIWDHLSRDRSWDLLQLCQMPEGSDTLEELPALAERGGCRVGTWPSGASPYVAFGSSWCEYYDSLAAKHRSNLRNRFKRLNQIGPVEMETIASDEGLAGALDHAFQLEAAAWKGDEGTAISCDGGLRKFYSLFAQRAAQRGWLRLHFLHAGPARVAFDYSLCYKNQIYLLKLGYHPAFAPYSPSNLLVAKVLEGAFERGIARYDFLGESADWKRCWAKESTPHRWLFVFSRGLKGLLLHRIKFHLIPFLKRARSRRT